MNITCPNCDTTYEIPFDLPEEGRKLKCANCANVWLALPQEEPELPPLEAFEPEAVEPEIHDEVQDFSEEATEQAEPSIFENPDEMVSPLDDIIEPTEDFAPDSEFIDSEIEFAPEQPEPVQDVEFEANEPEPSEEIQEADLQNSQDDVDSLFADPEPSPEPLEEPDEIQPEIAMDDPQPADEPEDFGDIADNLEAEPDLEPVDFVEEQSPEPQPDPILTQPQPHPEPLPIERGPSPEQMAVAASAKLKTRSRPPSGFANLSRHSLLLASGWGVLAISVIGFLSFAYYNSTTVVKAIPGAADVYERVGAPVNIRGLEFRGISYSWATEAGQPILRVKGSVVNITDKPLIIPTVVFALRDQENTELFHWAKNVQQDPLPAGKSTGFTAKIPSPPTTVKSLQIRFARSK